MKRELRADRTKGTPRAVVHGAGYPNERDSCNIGTRQLI